MAIRHKFRSPVSDEGLPEGAVKPSNWNDEHEIDGVLGALAALSLTGDCVPYLDAEMRGQLSRLTATGRAMLACAVASDVLALLGGAPLISPALRGTPTAPTAPVGTFTDQIATMAAVQNAINALVGGAPGALDTLNELAVAINDDASFAATVTNALAARLRVDAAQNLSPAQMGQARANLALGSASMLDVGMTAGKVVQLDGNARLPAVDASQLTGVIAAWAAITGKPAFAAVALSGSYADLSNAPALGTAATKNVGMTAGSVVQLDANAKLPALDGSQLINVHAAGSPASWTRTVLTAGSGIYALKAGCVALHVRLVGGGGGGGYGPTGGAGGAGSATTFGTLTAGGGTGGAQLGGGGGNASGGDVNISGANGQGGNYYTSTVNAAGGCGGASPFGGAGNGNYNNTGYPAAPNSGSGGGGGGLSNSASCSGGGGGAGGFVDKLMTEPSASYAYAVGSGGAGAAGSGAGFAGGAGGSGIIIIEEYYY